MKILLSKIIFRLIGWKAKGTFNFPKKCIIIAAPHTSNWDFIIGRFYGYIAEINPKYLAKSELFLPILGTLFRLNGAMPVDRNSKNNLVDQIVEKFNISDSFMLGIAPEGTRSRVDKWKTGFYHIAYKSNVPILLLALDFKNKEIGIINSLIPTGDINKDMIFIQSQFKDVEGKIPENYNPVIL